MNMHRRTHDTPVHLIEIGNAARLLGVTARTLRHYQDRGLIRSHRLARNVRCYDVGTFEQLRAIVTLRAAGVRLAAIEAILALRARPAAQRSALCAALAEALREQQARMTVLTGLATDMADDDAPLPPELVGLQAVAANPAQRDQCAP